MAQKKWTLKKDDADIAYVYIMRNLKNYKFFEHREDGVEFQAEKDFENVKRVFSEDKENFFRQLKKWIEKYLDDIQVKRLRTKIRVERSRWRNDRKQLTIDEKTHFRLSEYAKSYNITLSEAIEKLLDFAEEQDKQGKLF
ncbi:MAG TPA: hypothetical protein EYG74_07335 [Sulfurimonas autotrophica]|nr:hypothetical protein [Sulfurimonas autotrophica]